MFYYVIFNKDGSIYEINRFDNEEDRDASYDRFMMKQIDGKWALRHSEIY